MKGVTGERVLRGRAQQLQSNSRPSLHRRCASSLQFPKIRYTLYPATSCFLPPGGGGGGGVLSVCVAVVL